MKRKKRHTEDRKKRETEMKAKGDIQKGEQEKTGQKTSEKKR